MRSYPCNLSWSAIARLVLLTIVFSSCRGFYEETVSGVKVPVPNGLRRTADKPAELSFFGLSAGSASFVGKLEVDQVIEFYKQEMPARGWQPRMNLLSGGAVLAYAKDGQSILISIGRQNDETSVTLTVGALKP